MYWWLVAHLDDLCIYLWLSVLIIVSTERQVPLLYCISSYKFIETWEIWHKWDKTVNGNTFFSNKVLSLKQDRGFFHRMRARVQIKQTADSKCWRRPNEETYLLGTKSFFVVKMFAIIRNNWQILQQIFLISRHSYVDSTSSLPFGFW